MSLLSSILAALDRWEEWKAMRATPQRIEELEKRLAVLEELVGGRRPGDACPKCGRRTLRVASSHLTQNGNRRDYQCQAADCDFQEWRMEK